MKKKKKRTLKQHRRLKTALILRGMLINGILFQVLVVGFSFKGSIFPGAEAMTPIITTCAQIIAGLYGTTLAGYTFFLSRIDALTAADPTLDYITVSIKNRFKRLIWFITATVLGALFASATLLYWPQNGWADGFVYRLFCNEFLISMIGSIVFILFYAIMVVDPNCIPKEAEVLKDRLSGSTLPQGSAVEFLSLYGKIEERCRFLLPDDVLHTLGSGRSRRFSYDIQLLMQVRPDLKPLEPELEKVHKYYACAVNCRTLEVTEEMCQAAEALLKAL